MTLSDVQSLARGQVVLIPFPFTNLASRRVRPAILLTDPLRAPGPDGHFVFTGTQPPPAGSRIVAIARGSAEAAAMRLKFDAGRQTCFVHAAKSATLEVSLVRGRLGVAPPNVLDEIGNTIRDCLGLSAPTDD